MPDRVFTTHPSPIKVDTNHPNLGECVYTSIAEDQEKHIQAVECVKGL